MSNWLYFADGTGHHSLAVARAFQQNKIFASDYLSVQAIFDSRIESYKKLIRALVQKQLRKEEEISEKIFEAAEKLCFLYERINWMEKYREADIKAMSGNYGYLSNTTHGNALDLNHYSTMTSFDKIQMTFCRFYQGIGDVKGADDYIVLDIPETIDLRSEDAYIWGVYEFERYQQFLNGVLEYRMLTTKGTVHLVLALTQMNLKSLLPMLLRAENYKVILAKMYPRYRLDYPTVPSYAKRIKSKSKISDEELMDIFIIQCRSIKGHVIKLRKKPHPYQQRPFYSRDNRHPGALYQHMHTSGTITQYEFPTVRLVLKRK